MPQLTESATRDLGQPQASATTDGRAATIILRIGSARNQFEHLLTFSSFLAGITPSLSTTSVTVKVDNTLCPGVAFLSRTDLDILVFHLYPLARAWSFESICMAPEIVNQREHNMFTGRVNSVSLRYCCTPVRDDTRQLTLEDIAFILGPCVKTLDFAWDDAKVDDDERKNFGSLFKEACFFSIENLCLSGMRNDFIHTDKVKFRLSVPNLKSVTFHSSFVISATDNRIGDSIVYHEGCNDPGVYLVVEQADRRALHTHTDYIVWTKTGNTHGPQCYMSRNRCIRLADSTRWRLDAIDYSEPEDNDVPESEPPSDGIPEQGPSNRKEIAEMVNRFSYKDEDRGPEHTPDTLVGSLYEEEEEEKDWGPEHAPDALILCDHRSYGDKYCTCQYES